MVNIDVDSIRDRIVERYIHISRVPKKVEEGFKAWAKEEFCSDYGLAFKHLWDFYNGLIPSGVEHLEEAIEQLSNRLAVLELKPVEDEPTVKRLDGRGKIK